MNELSEAAKQVLRFVNHTRQPIFLTGKAGTGKTTLLREIIRTTHKNTVVVAPTGIAALNAGGVTIHSLFQLPFATFIPHGSDLPKNPSLRFENRTTLRGHFKMNRQRQAVLRDMELLIIDEVSMVRPDLLDAIDFMLQTVRRNSEPFGGVQPLFIGDLLQLPPVIKPEEWEALRSYYSGKYFFHALVIHRQPPVYLELSKIYRQRDATFVNILNNLRNNTITKEDIAVLNRYVDLNFEPEKHQHILLTTHNAKADAVNARSLEALPGKEYTFTPEIIGDFPEKIYPVEENLVLRKGARVMFIKNDVSPQKQYFNGKIGEVTTLSDREIQVTFPEGNTIDVDRYEWRNIKYTVDSSGNINEELLGTFVHYPIKLAWAITVHKSQGLTFDSAALDVSNVFQPGQAYVALSRLRSLKGLILLAPIRMNGLSTDDDVISYANSRPDQDHVREILQKGSLDFIREIMLQTFDFKSVIREWVAHLNSYANATSKSEKARHKLWCKMQLDDLRSIQPAAESFAVQLQKLFHVGQDREYAKSRVEAAFGYFFPVLERVLDQTLLTLQVALRAKKAKQFADELSELESTLTRAIMKLFKAVRLAEAMASDLDFTKETVTSEQMLTYKKQRVERARAAYAERHGTVIDDEHDEPRAKKPKPKKGSTFEETLNLWKEKLSVEEIARTRKLTPQTIYGHFARLIQEGKIDIRDIFADDRLSALEDAFSKHDYESLAEMKAQLSDEFSWEELKLFKAHLSKPVDS